ncbi:hypothetical protein C8J57DRAFT_1538406 [Mycena rebaudengoi]|nr:hypothetical protein C8J57DRAFT_1538406 [Mycena rebaudengoi]
MEALSHYRMGGHTDLPIDAEHVSRKHISRTVNANQMILKTWLSQANYVMDKSGMDADEYFIIESLNLRLSISFDVDGFTLQGTFTALKPFVVIGDSWAMAETPRDDVYLFLFPANVDDSGGCLAVHLPPEEETYYWSFDPNGIERLSQDALEELALPHVHFRAQAVGEQWSKEIYDCIAKFHRTKGFDPTNKGVAIELGYPLVDIDRLINLIYCDTIEVVDEGDMEEQEGGF